MTTTVTIAVNEFTASGPVALLGHSITFKPVPIHIDSTTDTVLSEDIWEVAIVDGVSTTLIPDSVSGYGVRIGANIQGWKFVTVANYPVGTISLADLVNNYAVNPTTLEPTPAPDSWWTALANLVDNSVAQANQYTDEQITGVITDIGTILPSANAYTDAEVADAVSNATAALNGAIAAEVIRADSAYVGQSLSGVIVATGASHAAVQAAATSAATFGTKVVASGTYTTSSTLIITSACDLSGLTINYTGTGMAVQIGSAALIPRKSFILPNVNYVNKPSVGWTAGTIGVQIMNLADCTVTLGNISGFESGAIFYASGTAYVSYNAFFIHGLSNNKVNLTLAADATGYVNQNNFYGGRYFHLSSEGTQVTGVYHVFLTDIAASRPNGNNWFGASFESPNVVQYAVNIESGTANQFIGCRWEDSSGHARVRYGAKSQRTDIIGGYAAEQITFTNVSGTTSNRLFSNDILAMSSNSSPLVRLGNDSSSGSPTLAIYNAGTLNGVTAYSPSADWSVALRGTGIAFKGKADTFERITIALNGISFGSGSIAQDVLLYRGGVDILKTDDKLVTVAGLGVGNSAAAATLGTVVKKMQVFDAAGASLGYIPIYDAIT